MRNQRLLRVGWYWASCSSPGSWLADSPAQVVQLIWSVDSSNVKPIVGDVPISLPRQTLTMGEPDYPDGESLVSR